MNKKNGSEDGLSNRQMMFYPINEVAHGISHVGNISNFALFQQLTKLLSSLHISLLMVGRWTKRPSCYRGKNKPEI